MIKMICKHCGEENLETSKFCKGCGAPLQVASPTASTNYQTEYARQEQSQNINQSQPIQNQNPNNNEKFKPITMWGYLGYELLFSIPIVGLIAILIFSFSSSTNVNLKNFARSYILLAIIVFVVTIVFSFILGMMGVSSSSY